MLFVFYVDTGTTITFDIKLALQTVAQLMEAIHRECGVEVKHQVLLMSGGECLEPEVRVCSYAAGTDTNPIYLFSKAAIDSQIPPTPCIDYGSDVDLQSQIDTSLAMPATYQTLVSRAQLAQQCCGLAREQTRICEKLVHDQHLQQQGWAAVIANLEDITQTYRTRSAFLQETFDFYLNEREQHLQLLSSFNADLEALAKLPILPALRAHAEGFLSPEDEEDRIDPEREKNAEILSLLRWISAKDNQSTLEQLVNYCSRGLEKYTEETINTLKDEAAATFEAAGKQEMKEIKGLGERLFALEQLMQQTKRLVQEQGELAQGFVQNQNRANNLGDPSILPDLCTSHRRQLLVMLQNHNQLRDIRRRCTKAKEELSANIFQRLKWITYVENRLMEVDARMYMYHDSLRRLRRHIEVVQQIHLAPQLYLSAVAEVVRRRTFSQAFLGWASNLACQLLTVHSEELERRREFESKFDGHFLNSLFPGLEDMPPPFATQAPSVFDRGLPKLTVDDMNSLRAVLPNMELAISTPDLDSITQFFLSKSLTEGSCCGNKEKDSSSMPVDVPPKEQEQTSVPMQTDRGGFESETDTEEFEKISQGAGDSKPSSFDGAKQKRQKQLEVGPSRSVSPTSSTSTNASPLASKVVHMATRSISSSSEPGSFHFPSLSTSDKLVQLSPLAECVENGESASQQHYTVPQECQTCKTCGSTVPLTVVSLEQQGSSSPNRSGLTRFVASSSSESGSFHIPMVAPEKPSSQLSPLAESLEHRGAGTFSCRCDNANCSSNRCDDLHHLSVAIRGEIAEDSPHPCPYSQTLSPNPSPLTRPAMCDGQQQRQLPGSGGSSPSVGVGATDFMGTEYYMDESLPSSLSEHPADGHHQAIVSLLQENLGSTRDEVERLRNILKTTKAVVCETIMAVKQEIAVLKDRYTIEKGAVSETIQKVRQALEMYSREHERCLVEREQELALEHEIEMIDVKDQVKRRDEDVEAIKQTLLEKETELAEHERLISTMRQKLDDGQTEMRNLQTRLCQQLNEALDKARVDKEAELNDIRDERNLEITTLTSSLAQSRKRIQELEENLTEARNEQQRMVKDVSDKLMMEYKAELETIRSRFKLMAASTMERSPSDSSLEKIERPDLIDFVNHEAILAQAKEDMKLEQSEAVRTAVEKERADCIAKLNQELELARQMVDDKDREVKTYRIREAALIEECKQYKNTIRQLTETESIVRQKFTEKVENLEAKQVWLESKIEQQDKKFGDRLDMRHSGLEEAISSLQFEKDDVEASESKKVRLEADGDISNLMRRLEMLEDDNKRLSTELQMVRQSKQSADMKLEVLMKENVDLMCKLQRSSAITPIDEGPSCSSKKREKDMSTSVAVISESANREGACSTSVIHRSPSAGCFHSSPHIRKKLTKITAKLVQQGCITVTSCNTGDIVLVLWDALHRNYTLYQDSQTLFFLNSDCISTLDLGMNPDGTPKRAQTIAMVVDKEYCHARKAENRYHVPLGTKFYRVRVRSVDKNFEASLLTKSQQQ